ncbi:mobile element protein [Streptomyces albireticuli]|uniref:Mobile element protein n=1 Tax=Streptomyces albireticuli TaxID=1940 RepID=A0A2A2D159_9ACTN|nr:mobile element protein [Streptomyces albireticuli]MCD9196072.1 mobile element protein [Streptomyces albireticuli]PAU46173.1 mobile element protein [Streptomyces albireticuli]
MATDLLADPAELAVWLGRPADDPKLLAALRAATRRFRGAVGHPVTLVAGDTVRLDGNGREVVLLPVWPTAAVASVKLDGVLLVAGTDYEWSESGILRRLGGQCWPNRLGCLEVVYTHGWAQIPDDVAEAIIDQARSLYTVVPGVQSKAVGGQSVTFGAQAAVGVTAQWSAAVARHQVRTGSDL